MKNLYRIALLFAAFMACCSSFAQSLDWEYGRNDFQIQHEGVARHFIVHVPESYEEDEKVPVILIFHGTNGQGGYMWSNSRWTELSELEGFIAVFPSSWKYQLISTGQVSEKWNFSHMYKDVVEVDSLKDDVGFVNKVLDGVIDNLNVDENRIYATGFSNGSAFVHTRILVEMNDRFAAAARSAGIIMNEFEIDGYLMPAVTTLGTKDGVVLGIHPDTILPYSVQGILNDPVVGRFMDSTLYALRLEKSFTVDSSQQSITFHFVESLEDNSNEWHFTMVNCIGHVYPNGTNNPWNLVVAPIFWEFFKQFELNGGSVSVKEELLDVPCKLISPLLGSELELRCNDTRDVKNWEVIEFDAFGNRFAKRDVLDGPISIEGLPSGTLFISFLHKGKLIRPQHVIKI